jgi:hypothetical protein
MRLQRMDTMVHISAMDLFRNLDLNLAGARKELMLSHQGGLRK